MASSAAAPPRRTTETTAQDVSAPPHGDDHRDDAGNVHPWHGVPRNPHGAIRGRVRRSLASAHELAVFAMTFNMTLPMVLWMRHRGHTWERCGEMAGAMVLLALLVLVPFWAGAISSGVVLPLEMGLMLPAMIGVMALRYNEYTTHAPAHSEGSTP